MPLTVLSVAFAFAPVGPHAVGGAEQILTELDGALTAAGHTSLVLACEDSQAAGTLFQTPLLGRDLYDAHSRLWCARQRQACLDRILSQHDVDVMNAVAERGMGAFIHLKAAAHPASPGVH